MDARSTPLAIRCCPALYRGRDKQGELQRFLALFADEAVAACALASGSSAATIIDPASPG